MVETLLFVGVLVKIFIVIQMLFNVMLFNAMFNAMLMLFKKEKYKLGQQSVLFYTQLRLSIGVDDNLYLHLYTRLTLGKGGQRVEKVPTLLKRALVL